jgi:hypothetical protein
MMVNYTITKNVWKKISSAGESGTAWLRSANGFSPKLLFCHTDQAQTYDPDDDPDLGALDDNIPLAEAVGLDVDASLVWKTGEPTPVMESENGDDVWYCTFRNGESGATCTIVADFVPALDKFFFF